MEEREFLHYVAPLFYCTSPDVLTGETRYKSLCEWNVILAVTLSEVVNEHYRVQLEAADYNHTETLAELFHCILSKTESVRS